jgi:hypothetical protein
MGYNVSYQLMWDTIRCLSLSGIGLSDDEIGGYLEEIEGDNHTFLHIDNLAEYKKLGLVTDELIDLIGLLRQSVEDISKHLWNAQSLREHDEWIAIHKAAASIFRQLKLPII